jgi:hypothetical protein
LVSFHLAPATFVFLKVLYLFGAMIGVQLPLGDAATHSELAGRPLHVVDQITLRWHDACQLF